MTSLKYRLDALKTHSWYEKKKKMNREMLNGKSRILRWVRWGRRRNSIWIRRRILRRNDAGNSMNLHASVIHQIPESPYFRLINIHHSYCAQTAVSICPSFWYSVKRRQREDEGWVKTINVSKNEDNGVQGWNINTCDMRREHTEIRLWGQVPCGEGRHWKQRGNNTLMKPNTLAS